MKRYQVLGLVLGVGLSGWAGTSVQAGEMWQSPFQYKSHLFVENISPKKNRLFVFSPRYLVWGAYDRSGKLIGSGRASGGADYCEGENRSCLTPRGSYVIQRKGTRDCKSSKYPRPSGGAWMPYCMHFYKGYAVHGHVQVPNYNASHGCIRLQIQAAKWLHKNFFEIGTRVMVLPY